MRFCGNKERDTTASVGGGWGGGRGGVGKGEILRAPQGAPGLGNVVKTVKGLNPEVISSVVWLWSSRWTYSWIGLFFLTVTDAWTTCVVVIFSVKVSCITSVLNYNGHWCDWSIKALSTRIRFHLKTQLFLYGHGFSAHVSDENDQWKRNFLKTLSIVELFEHAVFVCTCGQTKTGLFKNAEDTLSVPIHSVQY